jgi:hypothetical protein
VRVTVIPTKGDFTGISFGVPSAHKGEYAELGPFQKRIE